MISDKYISTSSNKSSEITFLRLSVGVLLLIILVEGMVLQKTLGMEKTVIVPPVIEKSFWVSGNEVSKNYLEQMLATWTPSWETSVQAPDARCLLSVSSI
ncbi:MAG: TraE/TraK family type IV conjugative transfer system protein [Proteobacteria bacterium]|nr:TraE/TraK family type IV conjugative transfer system protein [Pseudomonadota bacterium]